VPAPKTKKLYRVDVRRHEDATIAWTRTKSEAVKTAKDWALEGNRAAEVRVYQCRVRVDVEAIIAAYDGHPMQPVGEMLEYAESGRETQRTPDTEAA